MAASATLKVLRAAVRLGEFTQPELAAVSGASYETVKKVLRTERDERTVEQLDQTVGGTRGRPRVVWRVVDRALALTGGAGYMSHHPLSRAYRDVRAGAFMHPLGATRAYEFIGRIALGAQPALR